MLIVADKVRLRITQPEIGHKNSENSRDRIYLQ